MLEVSGAGVISGRLQWLLASRGTAESLLQPSQKSPSHFLTAEGAQAQGWRGRDKTRKSRRRRRRRAVMTVRERVRNGRAADEKGIKKRQVGV